MSALDDVVSVTVQRASDLTGLSKDIIRAAYKSGDLECRYFGSKVLIPIDGLRRWIDGLPSERASA